MLGGTDSTSDPGTISPPTLSQQEEPVKEKAPIRKSNRPLVKHRAVGSSICSEDKEECESMEEGKTSNDMQFKVLDYNVLADSYH